MNVDVILSRLQKVRSSGRNAWTACCPAHEDRGPSLAIAEKDDGVILLHCFAQCSTDAVLQAIGLTFDDLFPERDQHNIQTGKPIPHRIPAHVVLKYIEHEALIVGMAARSIANGVQLSPADLERIAESAEIINRSIAAAGLE